MENKDKPAFPNEKGAGISNPISGLTKREYFAAMAMQGILSNPELVQSFNADLDNVAQMAFNMANKMI